MLLNTESDQTLCYIQPSHSLLNISDLSDSETLEIDEMYTVEEEIPPENRRSSLEEPADIKEHEKKKRRPRPYRRSHSLAEIRRPSAIYIPEGNYSLTSSSTGLLLVCVSSVSSSWILGLCQAFELHPYLCQAKQKLGD